VEFVVIMSAILMFVVACVVLAPIGNKWDSREKRMKQIVGKNVSAAYEELELSFYKRFIYPKINAVSSVLQKYASKNKNKKANSQKLQESLRHAGIRISQGEYRTISLMVMLGIIVVSLILAIVLIGNILISLLIFIFGVISAVLVPRYFLTYKIKTRTERIRVQLPEVMDLLSVSIEAGLSFDAALIKISEKMSGPLVDDLKILYREIQMGRPRRDAFKNLADGSPITELKVFCSAMVQADQLGIPVNNVLKIQSSQLRVSRKQRAQEKGMKAPVKMMIPMIIFIFPVIFIILLGPTVIKLIEQFS
jgi:tight adherence protein C